MNDALLIIKDSFQKAWQEVLLRLKENKWELYNVIVQFPADVHCENILNSNYTEFTKRVGVLKPKSVAYTIFPYKLYKKYNNIELLSENYIKRIVPRLKKMERYGWGTYFLRMINYNGDGNSNQLKRIICAINDRNRTIKAGYTIVIEKPGGETVRTMGAPCLNYIALQLEKDKVNLLAVYRNHDFIERAYGNYLGLCYLLKFIAEQTGLATGMVTCVSSHAFVNRNKNDLKKFMEDNFNG